MKITISDALLAPWINGVIVTAVRLKVFSHVADGASSIKEIAAKCNARPERLKPLLDACVALGILNTNDKNYQNSHFSSVKKEIS